MKKVNENSQFLVFDAKNKPALQVRAGESVQFTCQDCWHNKLIDENDKKSELLATGLQLNPVNGPVYVEGAMPGDTLKIKINDISIIGTRGGMAFNIPDLGVLGQFFEKEETVFVPIEDGMVSLCDGRVKVEAKPMIGVISTTPADEPISSMSGGRCGGNIDCKHLTAGTTIYLPVEVPGALLGIGDLHALQGDGEVPAGLEIEGTVDVTIEVIKGHQEDWPVLETDDAWYVIATEDDMTKACESAMVGIGNFLTKRGAGYSNLDWMVLIGMVGDLEVCQIPNPRMTARYRIPKSVADKIEF
jgi:amidase